MYTDLTERLPVEILAMIFHAWKDTSRGEQMHGLRSWWVRATFVCQRWRDVAIGTPALWSSVLILRRPLAMQLDRAGGLALELRVLSRKMSERQVADAFGLVLEKKKSIKKLTIVFNGQQALAVEAFGNVVAAEVTSLSLLPSGPLDKERWNISSDSFPGLSRLVLRCIIPLPVPGAPLLSLTHLHLDGAVESFLGKADKPWTFVHRFLAACPNLETLRSVDSFEYPLDYLDPHNDYKDLPVVTLPRLRHLSVDGHALDTSTALGTLRLPALSTFDITADAGTDHYDCDFYVIPRNISESLPPVRRSRCLSFIVGGHTNDLSLRGGPGVTFSNEADWSITLPDLEPTSATSDLLGAPCCILYNCTRFLARLPQLVVPSTLVRLELHVSNGLPIANIDWVQFFGNMVRLQTLVVGGDKLAVCVLEAFETGPTACPRLEELGLCLGEGPTRAEVGPLVKFTTRTVGAWARGRARELKTLTLLVRISRFNGDDSVSERSSQLGNAAALASESDIDGPRSDGAGPTLHDTGGELAYLKLWCDLAATLKREGSDSVGEVLLKMVDCGACNAEYEAVDAVDFGDGGLREGVTYD